MNIKIGSVNDYNNMIQQATDDLKIGVNNTLNKKAGFLPNDSNDKKTTTNITSPFPTNTSLNTASTTPTYKYKLMKRKKVNVMMLPFGVIITI